jgi:hypothetical protein
VNSAGENTPPDPPTPMSPLDFAQQPPDAPVTLVATNGADADGDPIAYFFQISDRSSFDGGGVIGSGELPEGDGTTSWTAPEPLPEGVWYWRVWVSDGSARSVDRFGSFLVGSPDIPMPDAGLQSTPDAGVDAGSMIPSSGGCSIAPSGSDRFCGIALALAAALWLVRRRGETNR